MRANNDDIRLIRIEGTDHVAVSLGIDAVILIFARQAELLDLGFDVSSSRVQTRGIFMVARQAAEVGDVS